MNTICHKKILIFLKALIFYIPQDTQSATQPENN